MNDTGAANLQWSYALLDGLAAAGVDRVVISPGSRSTPLALASELHPSLRTWVQVDERCAAFFALGMARITAAPVVVIATSGSAPVHWYPAVIEADLAGIPLVLISADRPLELQGCGATQTIDQNRLFQQSVRAFHALPSIHHHTDSQDYLHRLAARAVHQSRWPLPGPVHINVPFHEPLLTEPVPKLAPVASGVAVDPPVLTPPESQLDRIADRIAGQPGLIVCGPGQFSPGFAPSLVQLAKTLGCPVLADPLSGLRFGDHDRSHILCHYDAFLRHTAFSGTHRPQWVLRFGNMPVSGSLLRYLKSLQAGKLILVDPSGRWPDPLHRVGEMLRATPRAVCDGLVARITSAAPASWRETFTKQEYAAAQLCHDMSTGGPWFEARAPWAALWPQPGSNHIHQCKCLIIIMLSGLVSGSIKQIT